MAAIDKKKGSVILMSVLAGVSQSAYSQSELDEVIVTAQKRQQNMQDVGIAITTLSGADMQQQLMATATDVMMVTPGLQAASAYGTGSSANLAIRGIGQNDFGEGHEAPVTAYVDEVYQVAVPATDFSMFDLERVEVLRGPQGTLFGRNSTGGLVHYVTAKPTQETSGFLSVYYGSFDEIKAEGAISGSLGDAFTARLSALSHHGDGFKKNLTPGRGDGGEAGTDAVRLQLQYSPDDDLRVLLKAEYGKVDTIHNYYEAIPLSAQDPVTGLFGVNPDGVDFAGYNEKNFGAGARNVVTANYPTFLKQDAKQFMLRIEKQLGGATLTSISGYEDLDRKLQEDCDATANSLCFAEFPYNTHWFTQELRLNGGTDHVRWTAGAYYLDQDAENHPRATFNIPLGGPTAVDPVTGLYNGFSLPIELAANWTMSTKSYSAFGQIEYDLAERWTAIAGLRWTKDKKKFYDADNATLRSCPGDPFGLTGNCFLVADGGVGIANPIRDRYSDDLLSFRAELDFRPVESVLLYASISRGTKSGGFNNGFYGGDIAANPGLIRYGSEKNTAYEAGFKSTLLNRRVRLNGSVFYYDYKDFQAFNWIGFGGMITNSDAVMKGGELELDAVIVDGLTTRLGMSVLDTTVKDVRGRNANYVADRDAAYAPKFTLSGALAYEHLLSDAASVRLAWDFYYSSKRYSNNFSEPSELCESYFVHNANIMFKWRDAWTLTVHGRNLSNKEYEVRSFTFGDLGYRQVMYARGRTYGATLAYRF